MKPRDLKMALDQGWSVLRLSVWLCGLPLRLRRSPLPALLHRLTPAIGRPTNGNATELDCTVRLVVWLCHRRPFRGPLFPRACLRQALALYYTLTRKGYPVAIHFGVHKDGEALHGHSWVTVAGQVIGERAPSDTFRSIYSYSCMRSQGGPYGEGQHWQDNK
jgi:hypothetical protein